MPRDEPEALATAILLSSPDGNGMSVAGASGSSMVDRQEFDNSVYERACMSDFALHVTTNLSELRGALEKLRDVTVPETNAYAVRKGMRTGLEAAIDATPVDTGRARAAWQRALSELGGQDAVASAGTSSAAQQEGAAMGSASQVATGTTFAVIVENGVPYITFLEHGTRGHPPRHIGRAALTAAEEVVREMWLEGFLK